MDYIVRAVDKNKEVRIFAITSRELVEEAREIHNTSPVATAALGRLLSAGAMMGQMLKGEEELLTLKMKGDGKINGVTVLADNSAKVKGYVGNPSVMLPPNYAGKLDVGAAIGYGELTVIKDMGLKEPYISKVPLASLGSLLRRFFRKMVWILTRKALTRRCRSSVTAPVQPVLRTSALPFLI